MTQLRKQASFAQRTYLANLKMQLGETASGVHTMDSRTCSDAIQECLDRIEDGKKVVES